MQILVIDDDPEVGDVMRALVAEAGHEATLVSDPKEIPQSIEPTLVLTDLIPLTGYTSDAAGAWVRALQVRFPRAAVVVCSAYSEASLDERLGAAAVISKPFDVEELLSVVARFAR